MARIFTTLFMTLTLGILPLKAADKPSWDTILAEADGADRLISMPGAATKPSTAISPGSASR